MRVLAGGLALSLAIVMVAGVGVALAQEFPPWATYGQVSPDRVLVTRVGDGYYLGAGFGPYTEMGRFAYGTICTQCSPDRVLSARVAVGYATGPDYAPFTVTGHYPFGAVTGQVSPDRVLAERSALTY